MIPLPLVRDEIAKLATRWEADASVLDAYNSPISMVARRRVAELWTLYDEIERACDRLTVGQFAQARNVEPATVRRWIRTGQLLAVKAADGDWQIKHDAVRHKRPRLRRVA